MRNISVLRMSDTHGFTLNHVPVIDEDNKLVDYYKILCDAVQLGYESIMSMVHGCRLRKILQRRKKWRLMAHKAGIPVEAELGQ